MTVLMPLQGRALKMLGRFPSFMRLEKPGKVISDVALALGGDLDQAEGRLGRILKARRIEQADEEGDILKLAASLGLVEEDFFLLRRALENGLFDPVPDSPDPEVQAWTAYDAYLDALRGAVMRTAAVMTDGCGTLWALAEGACIQLGAVNGGKPSLKHVDSFVVTKGFIHRMKIRFRMPDGADWKELEKLLYIHENPIVDKETELADARQRQRYAVRRGGFFHGRVGLRIVGVADRTVKPLVINLTSREGYGFRGNVPDGKELLISRDGHAYLDGADVSAQCYRVYDGFLDDAQMARIADGDPVHGFSKCDPVGANARNIPGPAVVGLPELPPPRLRHGDSTFRFSVEEGAFDASRFGQAVFSFPDQAAIDAAPPSGKFQAEWREHQAFTVRVLLPPELQSWEAAFLSGGDLASHVARGLERFRPAGVRLEVDFWNDAWVLGESLLEDGTEPDGEGVDFNAPNI